MVEGDEVLITIEDGLARLTLNRPTRLNAFNSAMHESFRAALDQIEAAPDLCALIITGAGKAFCAGQDLAERAAQLDAENGRGEVDLHASLDQNYNPMVRRLVALPFPVVGAVNGMASGAGAGLALACDLLLAGRSARFQFPFVNIGLGPDTGVSWTLPAQIGLSRALGLLLTGEAVDANTALKWGLVWDVVDDDALDEAVRARATLFARAGREAAAAAKRHLRASSGLSLDRALDAERDAQGQLGRRPDYRRAVTAFASKRTARST